MLTARTDKTRIKSLLLKLRATLTSIKMKRIKSIILKLKSRFLRRSRLELLLKLHLSRRRI